MRKSIVVGTVICLLISLAFCLRSRVWAPNPESQELERVSESVQVDPYACAAEAAKQIENACGKLEGLLASGLSGKQLLKVAAPVTDEEWSRMRRTRLTLAYIVTGCASATVSDEHLFRNRFLNPRDVYIPPPLREQLSQVLLSVRPELDRAYQARMAVYQSEFKQNARPIGPAIKRNARGADGQFSQVENAPRAMLDDAQADMHVVKDGQVLAASRSSMPMSRVVLEQQRFIELQLASALVGWFRYTGALDATESDALLCELAARPFR